MKIWSLAPLCLIAFSCLSTSGAYANSVNAIRQPGIFVSKNGACTAALKIAPQGGFLQLYIGRDQNHLAQVADDITGIAWATSASLIYSSSPVYGSPGVFLVACGVSPLVTKLVGAEHIDSAYPNGADYFELRAIVGHQVQFYYGNNVDEIDFPIWRSEKNTRTVRLPKSGTH